MFSTTCTENLEERITSVSGRSAYLKFCGGCVQPAKGSPVICNKSRGNNVTASVYSYCYERHLEASLTAEARKANPIDDHHTPEEARKARLGLVLLSADARRPLDS